MARIAIGSIAVGLATILISFMIFRGFKHEILRKIFSFSGHIEIVKYDMNNSYENLPLSTKRPFYETPKIPEIAHIQGYSQKPALLRTSEDVMGILVKGINQDFDSLRFKPNMKAGKFPNLSDKDYSKQIVISEYIANKLRLKVGDEAVVFFIQNRIRARKMFISGIYHTGIEDFDQMLIFADNRLIQRLNNWEDSMVGGYEIYLHHFDVLDESFETIIEHMDYDMQAGNVKEEYAHFFDWFTMLNRNVYVILAVILVVACFNTASILLILVMERTQMIGILKALGATDHQIKKIFIFNGLRMTLKGILYGNLIGLGFGLVQQQFKILPLNPEYYYISFVPIAWDWMAILGVNILLIAVIAVITFIPVAIIAKITPIKAIRFD